METEAESAPVERIKCLQKDAGCTTDNCEQIVECEANYKGCYAVTDNSFLKEVRTPQTLNHIDGLNNIIFAGCWAGESDCLPPEDIYTKYDPPDPEDVALAHGIVDAPPTSHSIDRNHHPLIHTNRSRTDGVFVAAELLEPRIQHHCIGYIEDKHRFTIKYNQTFCCCLTSTCNRNVILTQEKNPFITWSERTQKEQNEHQQLTTVLSTATRPGGKSPDTINGSMSITDKEITAIIIGTIGFFCLFIFLFLVIFYKKKLCSASKHQFPSLFHSSHNLEQHRRDSAAAGSAVPNGNCIPMGAMGGGGGLLSPAGSDANNSPAVFSDHPFIQFKTLNLDRYRSAHEEGNHFYEEERQPFLMGSSNDPALLKELYANRKPSLGAAAASNNVQGLPHFLQLQQPPPPLQQQQALSQIRPDSLFNTDFKSIDDGCIPSRLRAQDLQLVDNIANGKLSTVWKGRCRTDDSATPVEYAVKVFTPQQKSSWVNERDIYNILSLSMNDNILKFICADIVDKPEVASTSQAGAGGGGAQGSGGGEEQSHPLQQPPTPGILEFWIVTEYHALGSLHDYLKANHVTWAQMVTLADCILDGLSYLHSENVPENMSKTFSIAHRDIKSKNILVTRRGGQLACCIADFGLALTLENASKLSSSEIRNKVGTSRYMSPELLEGAISFTKETFLRIDVYACALVLWELMTRGDFYEEKNDYKMPFEAEVGSNPSMEHMKMVVVVNSQRPKIKPEWLKYHQMSVIARTVEECWDIDLDARLSSECASARIKKILSSLEKS